MKTFFKKFFAFFIKDLKIALSYRFNILFQLFVYVSIFSFLFFIFSTNLLIFKNETNNFDQNFSSVFIGFALIDYMFSCISVFSREVRLAQTQGTFETLLVTNTSITTIIVSSYALTFIRASLRIVIYFIICKFLFGLDIDFVEMPAFLAIIFYSSLPFIGIGLFSAAFVIIFKVGNVINFFVGISSIFFSGIFFPTSVLPQSLIYLSEIIPLNLGLELTKTIIFDDYNSANYTEMLTMIGLQIILFLPTGIFFVYYALKLSKKNGSLNYY